MERRVIKFNLVGAICVLILVISLIIGAIIGVKKLKNSNKQNNTQNSEKEQIEEINEQEIEVEKIDLAGEETEIFMKTCKGTFNYTMKYEYNMFFPQKNIGEMDRYTSLYSDTIRILVQKGNEDIFKNIEEFIEQEEEKDRINMFNFYYTQEKINGQNAVKKKATIENEIIEIYYVQSKDNKYLRIEASCGTNFEQEVMPIIEKMIESFKVL